MATIVTQIVGNLGPWLVVRYGLLTPHDGRVIENLLRAADWDRRSHVTFDTRKLEGFVYGAERALRYAARVIKARPAAFHVLYDPDGPASEGLVMSGVLADLDIDFSAGPPDPFN
jgi:hypothetical protein